MRLHCLVLIDSLLSSSVCTVRGRYRKKILLLRHGKTKRAGHCELVIINSRKQMEKVLQINSCSVRRFHFKSAVCGCVTIELQNPPLIICIKEAPVFSLRNFVVKIQQVLRGELVVLEDVKGIPSMDFAFPVKKLNICSQKDYEDNKRGFPSSLQELTVSNIGLTTVDSRWFGAINLVRLDLSSNKLGCSDIFQTKFLNIARLKLLKILILSGNEIECISDDLWRALPEKLTVLNLSANRISFLSPCSMRFPFLTHLFLSGNKIEELPRNIKKLKNLRFLDISYNALKFLPHEIKSLSLDTLDITAYNREEVPRVQRLLSELDQSKKQLIRVGSLFECAAAAILNQGIDPSPLPKWLYSVMVKSAEYCTSPTGKSKYFPASIVAKKVCLFILPNALYYDMKMQLKHFYQLIGIYNQERNRISCVVR
ncbi:unnamed protein product [Thelazia callipaeda]|uniref:Leucine-rich repeat protein 1 n=1 Tax=Thelazia callipaeda TaxID=103827 RepID=A0A0N5CNP9_THECL|nr:unnamed protein product [Thelazia callipaeda]